MPKDPTYIDWRRSEAKLVLLDDLQNNVLPLDENVVPPEQAWAIYKEHEAFKGLVEFKQFKVQLKAHRQQVMKKKPDLSVQLAALQHDRRLHPRASHNNRGEPVFDMSEAKALLRADVEQNRHVGISTSQLRETREAYKQFPKKIFKELYQELRRQKFIYYMNWKRAKKVEKAKKARLKAIKNRNKLKKEKEEALAKAAAEANGKRRRTGR